MFIYINKSLSGPLREPKNKGKVQLGNGPKVVAVAYESFSVVSGAGWLQEWLQGVFH